MTYQTVPFQLAGPSYQSRSKPLSSQQTVNWYPQYTQEQNEQAALLPFYGLLEVGSVSTALPDRGMSRMAEALYQVKGNNLYSIDKFGAHTLLGSIPGNDRCIFANDGINLVIVADRRVFIYSTDTNNIIESTELGVTGAQSVDIITGFFLFTFPSETFVAILNNATKTFQTDTSARADIKPDALVRDFVFEQTIWRMGARTIEGWYVNASLTPPIARLDGQVLDVGLKAINSVAATDEYFYWLGDDSCVYRSRSGVKDRVSSDAISNALEKADNENATAYTFTIQGQNFYCLTLPDLNKTFVVNEALGQQGWFELSSGIKGDKYQGTSLIDVYGCNYVADERNGKIYKLDIDTFTNDNETLKRTRVTKAITGKALGRPGERIQMSEMLFTMETGEGLLSGQGENPRIMIEASYDGGKTWSAGTWARTGRLGEHVLKVEWFNLRSFYEMSLRITTTDPVNFNLFGATVKVRLAGR